jgi:hypothetical protein
MSRRYTGLRNLGSQDSVSSNPSNKDTSFHYLHSLFCFVVPFRLDRFLNKIIAILQLNIHRFPFLMNMMFIRELVKKTSHCHLTSFDRDQDPHQSMQRAKSFIRSLQTEDADPEILSSAVMVKDPSLADPSADDWGHFADFHEDSSY